LIRVVRRKYLGGLMHEGEIVTRQGTGRKLSQRKGDVLRVSLVCDECRDEKERNKRR